MHSLTFYLLASILMKLGVSVIDRPPNVQLRYFMSQVLLLHLQGLCHMKDGKISHQNIYSLRYLFSQVLVEGLRHKWSSTVERSFTIWLAEILLIGLSRQCGITNVPGNLFFLLGSMAWKCKWYNVWNQKGSPYPLLCYVNCKNKETTDLAKLQLN